MRRKGAGGSTPRKEKRKTCALVRRTGSLPALTCSRMPLRPAPRADTLCRRTPTPTAPARGAGQGSLVSMGQARGQLCTLHLQPISASVTYVYKHNYCTVPLTQSCARCPLHCPLTSKLCTLPLETSTTNALSPVPPLTSSCTRCPLKPAVLMRCPLCHHSPPAVHVAHCSVPYQSHHPHYRAVNVPHKSSRYPLAPKLCKLSIAPSPVTCTTPAPPLTPQLCPLHLEQRTSIALPPAPPLPLALSPVTCTAPHGRAGHPAHDIKTTTYCIVLLP